MSSRNVIKKDRTLSVQSCLKLIGILAFFSILFLGTINHSLAADTQSSNTRDQKIESLEKAVHNLMEEIKALKTNQNAEKMNMEEQKESLSTLKNQVEEIDLAKSQYDASWINKFDLGGYGEMHANFTNGSDKDVFDIHRLVFYVGYDFNEWIKFRSELEIEHAFVSDDSDGELAVEQAYVEFLLSDPLNVRAGRILTPLGIINQKHEPPSFNGVERPSFAKYIIPSTWSSDGLGIFGRLCPSLKYELYVVGSLDGSEFDAKNGIRDGRIKERPGLSDPAVTGRLDFYPFAKRAMGYDQRLRLGLSSYWGGLDNGNNGKNPDIDGDILIYAGDFEYSILKLDFRGAIAFEDIDGAREIGNGTASEIFGWYAETGYHFLPENFKKGLLEKSDAVVFVRYDDYDTQYKMPQGVAENPAGDRTEWTFGLSFYPIPNLVVKADYQLRDDGTGNHVDDLFNLGIGWQF